MGKQHDTSHLLAEVEQVLRRHGVNTEDIGIEPEGDRVLVDIANRLLEGTLDREKVAGLTREQRDVLPRVLQALLAARRPSRLRHLQELNPFYGALSTKVVRDSGNQEEDP